MVVTKSLLLGSAGSVRISGAACSPFAAGLILNQMAYSAGKNTSVRTVPPKVATDQGVRQRSPEDGVGERNERQHRGKRRQNDRTGALHGGLDDGIEWRQSILLVLTDLSDHGRRVAHQDSSQRDHPDRRR